MFPTNEICSPINIQREVGFGKPLQRLQVQFLQRPHDYLCPFTSCFIFPTRGSQSCQFKNGLFPSRRRSKTPQPTTAMLFKRTQLPQLTGDGVWGAGREGIHRQPLQMHEIIRELCNVWAEWRKKSISHGFVEWPAATQVRSWLSKYTLRVWTVMFTIFWKKKNLCTWALLSLY